MRVPASRKSSYIRATSERLSCMNFCAKIHTSHGSWIVVNRYGAGRWTLRLLADEAVELGYCRRLSHTDRHAPNSKNELQSCLRKIWCLGKLDALFLARMEQPLPLYALPYGARSLGPAVVLTAFRRSAAKDRVGASQTPGLHLCIGRGSYPFQS